MMMMTSQKWEAGVIQQGTRQYLVCASLPFLTCNRRRNFTPDALTAKTVLLLIFFSMWSSVDMVSLL